MQTETTRLGQLFSNLDRWRHLPCYQFERRIDIFFSLYLTGLISSHVGKLVSPKVIPEFPLRQVKNSLSNKVDYLLFAEDLSTTYFVELKTDCNSRNPKQDAYLARCVNRGFHSVLQDLFLIAPKTESWSKYRHLLYQLENSKQIQLPDGLLEAKRRDRDWGAVKITAADKIHVIYIQPTITDESDCIDFKEVVEYLKPESDPISMIFRDHLQRWCDRAGDLEPRSFGAVR